jgi:hypothetical protein
VDPDLLDVPDVDASPAEGCEEPLGDARSVLAAHVTRWGSRAGHADLTVAAPVPTHSNPGALGWPCQSDDQGAQ